MNRIDWRKVIIGGMIGVLFTGCASSRSEHGAAISQPGDSEARLFAGTIISWRPNTSTMLISKDEYHGHDNFPNVIYVKYDANTRFYVDNQPATLDQLEQFMNVTIRGHMRDGQVFAEDARFSSALPENVRRADAKSP